MIAYKLLTKRKSGTLGPLFINRRQVIELNRWYEAEDHPTKGYAHRPGWHAAPAPNAPHLVETGRVWCKVELSDYRQIKRPASQGGVWFIANMMRVLEEM